MQGLQVLVTLRWAYQIQIALAARRPSRPRASGIYHNIPNGLSDVCVCDGLEGEETSAARFFVPLRQVREVALIVFFSFFLLLRLHLYCLFSPPSRAYVYILYFAKVFYAGLLRSRLGFSLISASGRERGTRPATTSRCCSSSSAASLIAAVPASIDDEDAHGASTPACAGFSLYLTPLHFSPWLLSISFCIQPPRLFSLSLKDASSSFFL